MDLYEDVEKEMETTIMAINYYGLGIVLQYSRTYGK